MSYNFCDKCGNVSIENCLYCKKLICRDCQKSHIIYFVICSGCKKRTYFCRGIIDEIDRQYKVDSRDCHRAYCLACAIEKEKEKSPYIGQRIDGKASLKDYLEANPNYFNKYSLFTISNPKPPKKYHSKN